MKHQSMQRVVRAVRRRVHLPVSLFRLFSAGKPSYECPVCGYQGPFRNQAGHWISKRNTACPACGSTERTRMLWLVLSEVLDGIDARSKRAIHFAPEPLLSPLLRTRFAVYETSSFDGGQTDHQADLRALPFPDASYDVLIASHVLEHIQEDRLALGEIRRVLKPGGVAILPVPLVSQTTVEYGAPRPEEEGHVRAAGLDYYDRYRDCFTRVDIKGAQDYGDRFHLLPEIVNRPSLGVQYIPVCHA
jgi:SAM-dependent methyltransferase